MPRRNSSAELSRQAGEKSGTGAGSGRNLKTKSDCVVARPVWGNGLLIQQEHAF